MALAALLSAGCASSPGGEAGDAEAVVVVENSASTISDATIYLVPETGVRTRLGSVTLNGTESFAVNDVQAQRYVLVAEHGVQELTSNPFTLTRGMTVQWDLSLNQITFGGDG